MNPEKVLKGISLEKTKTQPKQKPPLVTQEQVTNYLLNTWEAETGGLRVWGQPGLPRATVSPKNQSKQNFDYESDHAQGWQVS